MSEEIINDKRHKENLAFIHLKLELEKSQARIAALEMALRGIVLKPGQVVELSKLGDLFQALLESHRNRERPLHEAWAKAEALRKEVGL